VNLVGLDPRIRPGDQGAASSEAAAPGLPGHGPGKDAKWATNPGDDQVEGIGETMYRILVPVDGSEAALKALGHAIRLARLSGEQAQIHLLNVQTAMPGTVGTFVGAETVARYHQEESEAALVKARQMLEREGLPVHADMRLGSAGEAIAAHAKDLGCEQIVMGCRGLGRIAGLVLGSVATQVVHLAQVPVTLVK
jgi:nucleotide-binding universal stress UspA family protein